MIWEGLGSGILFLIGWNETKAGLYLQSLISLGIKWIIFCFRVNREIVYPIMFYLAGKSNLVSYWMGWNCNLIVFAVSRFAWNQMTCPLFPCRSEDCECNRVWLAWCRVLLHYCKEITWIPVLFSVALVELVVFRFLICL